jgi:hypothetical protein
LGRVAGSYWDQVRELIEDWASHVPTEHRADLIGRLRSTDNRQFHSAFWELYLHESLRRSGYAITIHPILDGTSRKPDFHVTGGQASFYLEAKALLGNGQRVGRDARLKRLYDALDQLNSPNFFLAIDVRSVGPSDLPTKTLRSKIEAWLNGLDPDVIAPASILNPDRVHFTWQADGWSIELRPLPVREDARGRADHRPLGMFGDHESPWVDDSALRTALEEKGSAYGDLDAPLVIALNSFGFNADEFEVMNALYGSLQVRFSLSDPSAPAETVRASDGYWARQSWAHQHVAGVLIGRSVSPFSASTAVPTLWRHPAASQAIAPLPQWRIAQPVDDHIEYSEATQAMHELFDLPERWPIGEPFPETEGPSPSAQLASSGGGRPDQTSLERGDAAITADS